MRILIQLAALMVLGVVFTRHVEAQPTTESLQNRVYAAYVSGDMAAWEQTLNDMDALFGRQPTNQQLLYDLVLARYGLIGYYLGTEQKDRAAACLKRAQEHLEKLSAIRAYENASRVFESAFLGFRIGLQPLRAVQLGPRSYRLIDQAIESDPNYARAWIEKANATFYTPAMFGGNKAASIEHYKRAILLMERSMPNSHRWLYLSTLLALAHAYAETGDLTQAIRTTEKALRFEPDFAWARDEVLPRYKEQARR